MKATEHYFPVVLCLSKFLRFIFKGLFFQFFVSTEVRYWELRFRKTVVKFRPTTFETKKISSKFLSGEEPPFAI